LLLLLAVTPEAVAPWACGCAGIAGRPAVPSVGSVCAEWEGARERGANERAARLGDVRLGAAASVPISGSASVSRL
jgi:hypothetical protein